MAIDKFKEGNKFAEKWTEEKALSLGNKLIEWLKAEEENIFFAEFLYINNDYYEELISYLTKKFKSFLNLIEKAKKIQEIKLMKFGCFDKLNSTMTKFTLTNNHGWKDKQDMTTDGEQINNKEFKVIIEKE